MGGPCYRMSGVDEQVRDFPLCSNCSDCSEFWYYDSPINDEKNIFFNPKHWLGNRPTVIMLDDLDGWGQECTLEELNAIGDADICCSNCDGKASKEVKDMIMQIARRMIIHHEED